MTRTIAAVSSPGGPGLRGVIRLSGPEAGDLLSRALVGRPDPPPRRAAFAARFDDGRGSQPCLVLWMPGPASYTREDVAELHLPGAPPLLSVALERLLELGCAAARPGEFTRRAFLNGRLDLTQAEGVLALVEAGGEAERRAALALIEGGLARRLEDLREGLEDLRSLAEASLDFDESDTGHVPTEELGRRADALLAQVSDALSWEVRRQAPSTLPLVVLAGRPNAGKSSLFNALVPGAEALVSSERGSTRDGLRGLWPAAGAEVLLQDAPGLDPAAEGADRRAQDLADRERRRADLVLHLVDAAGSDPLPEPDPRRLLLWSRCDRAEARRPPTGVLAISAHTGEGLEALGKRVARVLGLGADDTAGPASAGSASLVRELSARHRQALVGARRDLGLARELLEHRAPLDQVAETLRQATDSLDAIGGRTTPEDLLDRIFARFCLGK